MKFADSNPQKRAKLQKKASEQEQKKEAWKKYEMNLKRARNDYSELDLDDD